jgi:hypothetical protein
MPMVHNPRIEGDPIDKENHHAYREGRGGS